MGALLLGINISESTVIQYQKNRDICKNISLNFKVKLNPGIEILGRETKKVATPESMSDLRVVDFRSLVFQIKMIFINLKVK